MKPQRIKFSSISPVEWAEQSERRIGRTRARICDMQVVKVNRIEVMIVAKIDGSIYAFTDIHGKVVKIR